MPNERTFTASTIDERMPALLVCIQVALRTTRNSGYKPRAIVLNTPTYLAIAEYLGVCDIDKLFGLDVQSDPSSDAQPLTLTLEQGT